MKLILLALILGISLAAIGQRACTGAFNEETRSLIADIIAVDLRKEGRTSVAAAGGNMVVARQVYRYKNSWRNHLKSSLDDYKKHPCIYKENRIGDNYMKLDSIMLSPDEQRQLLTFFRSRKRLRWPDTMMPSVRFFTLKKNSWQVHYANGFFRFSRPLFMRNNTVAFLYFELLKGDADCYGAFSAYRKGEHGWEAFGIIDNWEGFGVPE